jgi:mRNA interferase RelE/StbE
LRVAFKRSFVRDLEKIRNQSLKDKVRQVIELVKQADNLQDIPHIRKLRGSERYYRIRLGNYRIGLAVDGNEAAFVRFLHRRDVYRYFP